MRHILKVLATVALMAMLLAVTVSPAFAAPEWKEYYPKWGYGAQGKEDPAQDCHGAYAKIPGCGWASGHA